MLVLSGNNLWKLPGTACGDGQPMRELKLSYNFMFGRKRHKQHRFAVPKIERGFMATPAGPICPASIIVTVVIMKKMITQNITYIL